jgi:hypothetical protein
MASEDFSKYTLDELYELRTKYLGELAAAEQRAIKAGVDPTDLAIIIDKGQNLAKIQSQIDRENPGS